MTDQQYMSIALKLAEKNLGNVFPNPTVGCIIVKDSTIIGKGCTAPGGRPHAEAVALQSAKDVEDATMYVTLEPCCHYGKTGPCTLEIIKSKLRRVVVATVDPDSRISGRGIQSLEEAGIQVDQGVLCKEAQTLNVGFFTTRLHNRPYIACKVATTLDGKIACFNGHSKWITCEDTRKWVHELRSTYDAVMIGSNTLVVDNPLLTCRVPGLEAKSPIRLVLDTEGRLKSDHNVAKTADQVDTWVITNNHKYQPVEKVKYLEVDSSSDSKVCLKDLTSKLVSKIGITRLLVEGGGVLITQLLKQNLVDRLIICRSGKILGNDGIPFVGNLALESISKCYMLKKAQIIDLNEDVVEIWDYIPK